MARKNLTTIPLRKPTRDRLKALGRKDETYDELLNRLMDAVEGGGGGGGGGASVRFERVD